MVSTTRMLTSDKERARSFARLTICEPFTPVAGSISYRVMTGPGEAATTRTSTPKSLSFFSISREVISSDSGVTVSMRPAAVSSRSSWGSLLSPMSANRGFCFSLTTRSDLGTSTTGCSMIRGMGSAGSSCRTSSTTRSRSMAACSPMRMSWAASRLASRRSRKPSSCSPMRSASSSHEKPNARATPVTSKAIQSTPEPLKPSQCMPACPRPSPRMPPACSPGSPSS